METFRAYRINEQDGNVVAGFEQISIDDLTAPEKYCGTTR